MSILVAAPSTQPISIDQPASRPFRGLIIALLLSIPFWFVAAWLISRFF